MFYEVGQFMMKTDTNDRVLVGKYVANPHGFTTYFYDCGCSVLVNPDGEMIIGNRCILSNCLRIDSCDMLIMEVGEPVVDQSRLSCDFTTDSVGHSVYERINF